MGIVLNDNIDVHAPKPTDARNFNNLAPWASVAAAKAGININVRHIGLTINVDKVEYRWENGVLDSDLVLKTGSGLTTVAHDTSLSGEGTIRNPLSVVSGGGVTVPALRMYGVHTFGLVYTRNSYKGDGTDEFLNYEPKIVLFKRRRWRNKKRSGTQGTYPHVQPKGFSMSMMNLGGQDQMGRMCQRDIDPNARCTVNDLNTVRAGSNVGGEHKSLLISMNDFAQWFYTNTLPYDPVNNIGAISRAMGAPKRSKSNYFKFAIMIHKDGKYILGPLSETVKVNYIQTTPTAQALCINVV